MSNVERSAFDAGYRTVLGVSFLALDICCALLREPRFARPLGIRAERNPRRGRARSPRLENGPVAKRVRVCTSADDGCAADSLEALAHDADEVEAGGEAIACKRERVGRLGAERSAVKRAHAAAQHITAVRTSCARRSCSVKRVRAVNGLGPLHVRAWLASNFTASRTSGLRSVAPSRSTWRRRKACVPGASASVRKR